ncbi:tail assembly protein [Pseudomonas sp. BIGb0427]|uniref:tail assembly protein n=1 Tax=Pseudomonas sp. BIGb0427 TaxID=2724470 RepID=UPI0016A4C2F0|nr:tail assembly protein [Pseudomonas sp. BIGb0427]NLU60418.1 tail assembly protein [Pseudomonas sp. BIGb0427]QPG62054.1 tail assembly protein [Pseudomonas sp. BIGb0427]
MAATAAHYTPKTKIRLFGFLRKKYGKVHSYLLDRGDPREAAKAIDVNHPGFARDMVEAESRGLRFAIFKNGKNISEGDLDLGGARELWFVPVVVGSKRAGLLQTIIGAVIFVASSFVPGMQGWGHSLGASLALGGAIQMLSPQAKGLSQSAAPENLPSYAFGSAKNTTASGNPVPICIGERRWGGAIISASIYAEDKT